MTYREAMEVIEYSKKYGSVPGLDTIKELLDKLGNPQEQLSVIHVGGTNGKGSTAAYLSFILAAAGCQVGRYVSPVIFEYRECIQVTKKQETDIVNCYIQEEEVAACIEKIDSAITEMLAEGKPHPTTFEIETAMAFLYFSEKQCDVVVLEVGMGGSLDATNVIKTSLCSVLTSISMDHMKFLGNDLASIAKEKAGILKENGLAVCYDYCGDAIEKQENGEVILSAITHTARKRNTILAAADFSQIREEKHSLEGIRFSYREYENITLHLLGENQVKNAALAIEVMIQLNESGRLAPVLSGAHFREKDKFSLDAGIVSKTQIYEGLEKTIWKGRFSVISENPLIIADGAHNQGAAKSLAKSLELYLHHQPCIFVVGVFADKEYDKVLELTAPYAETIITIEPKHERALSSEILAQCAKKYCSQVIDAKDIETGMEKACALSGEKTPIITFGSLSFVKDVYEFVKKKL